MELGRVVCDGCDRYHNEVGVDFDLVFWHDVGITLHNCTPEGILRCSWYAGLLLFRFVWLEAPLFSLA